MAGQDVTTEITFKRWTISSDEDAVECARDIVARGVELSLPFNATPYGRAVVSAETQQWVEVWTLQVSDGTPKGGGQITADRNVVINQGSLLLVLTPAEAIERGYST